MITVDKLTKQFGDFFAVNGLTFTVEPGEILGFLGPNGAGKSTTMKMLTGFLQPSSGSVSVMGFDVLKTPVEAKRLIGYLPEGAPAYADMTVLDSLRFVGKVRGFSGSDLNTRIQETVDKVALNSVLNKRVETLSKGFQRRLGLAQAILHDPQVLILDEPTDGLDPNQKHQVRELIQNLSKDKIVIVSTHILEEVSAVCTRAMILSDGAIKFDGTPEDLAAKSVYHNSIHVHVAERHSELKAKLIQLPRVSKVNELSEGALQVLSENKDSILSDVNAVLHSGSYQIDELHVEQGKLDDVFRAMTSKEVNS
ncbi:multidrug ABC transporter ATP-binding protein [Oleiphilus sp. HI0009]|nr:MULTISPECIES: ATP-binding cassette domain-containing protein [unclassified Oleiphilus]KZX75134.1 multidrug ABC transporter ATP-binding protein [Oleiphilus sp. HI0009]KZY70078.1 multidrug ABC transporter ATP-binding protein [Oleiphilus sp. HI0067]KZY71394.1 multidrug ABC transporter ATP-binding protein [Oleiphilus sp. HI0067]KZY71768.1 multidrug ABC transporter ATP-binding protein [Oleiphilus sp. HI0066]